MRRHAIVAAIAVLSAGLLAAPVAGAAPVRAATSVRTAPCTQSGIQAALNRGGSYDFRADCTLALTRTLGVSAGAASLNAAGHRVIFTAGSGLTGPAFMVTAGSFSLTGVTVSDITLSGRAGAPGRAGTSFSGTATGDDAGVGGNGGYGQAAEGAGITAQGATVVTLINDTFTKLTASGGAGGTGGNGGNGDNGQPIGNMGPGGLGGSGGVGGMGGNAFGAAVFSAGTVVVSGGSFTHDTTQGGTAGTGGSGGTGGTGGAAAAGATNQGGQGGQGGVGGMGGAGGAAHGGALYVSGLLSVRGTRFAVDRAIGGAGGNAGNGAAGGATGGASAAGGTGGDGGNGGSGGNASGGAIYAPNRGAVAGASYSYDVAQGGTSDCASGGGCGGKPGAGQANGPVTTGVAPDGRQGVNGAPGTSASADTSIRLSGLSALVVRNRSLPYARKGVLYRVALSAAGGAAPYSWTANGLPRGLTVSAAGVLSGRASVTGSFHVTVKVSDAYAATPMVRGRALTIAIRR